MFLKEMKIDTNKQEDTNKVNVVSAKLCFENLQCTNYKPGYIITSGNLAKERKNSSLRELAEFTDILVDNCTLNESNGTSMIFVRATASGKDNMQKLYEWLEKYAGKENVEGIAPGLLESLNINKDAEEDSVASRFAKYRKLYEEESVTEDDIVTEDDTVTEDKDEKDEKEEAGDEDDKEKETEKTDDEEKEDDSEDEEELTAVIIEVAKGDEDKAKDELVEAGVDEDDIEILSDEEEKEDEEQNEDEDETEDDKEETVKIKIAIDSFDALKEYLEGKGFDLEEELGGEIVTGDEEEGEGDEDKEEGEGDENMDDAFAGFDDLFADDEESDKE